MITTDDAQRWRKYLSQRLRANGVQVARWRRYYDGDHDLPVGPQQHRAAYQRFQELSRTNLCKICVDSMVHRLAVVGYRLGTDSPAAPANDVWSLWQRLNLDSRQFSAFTAALVTGAGYLVVGADAQKRSKPRVTVETAENAIVDAPPDQPWNRRAALVEWHDSTDGHDYSTLYVHNQRFYYVTENKSIGPMFGKTDLAPDIGHKQWVLRKDIPNNPSSHNLGVPVIPLYNGDEVSSPVAEFAPGLSDQDRLNLTLLNRLTAERYASFRKEFLTNFEPDYDEETGLPIPPFNPGADQLYMIPPPEPGDSEPHFGSLPQTDTSQMLRATEGDMRAFAAVTLTPVYYLPGDLNSISEGTSWIAEAGRVAKIEQRKMQWSEPIEEMLSLCARIAGIDDDLSEGELIWKPSEVQHPVRTAEYAKALREAGYPLLSVAERIGETPQQIRELRRELAADSLRTNLQAQAGEQQ